jgi:hypothetical protein
MLTNKTSTSKLLALRIVLAVQLEIDAKFKTRDGALITGRRIDPSAAYINKAC